jgi:hypothetical protein
MVGCSCFFSLRSFSRSSAPSEKERQVTFTERLRAAGDLAKRDSRETEVPSYPRNPWTGIHAGRQVLYDLRHPLLFGRRVMAGLRGEIPQISKEQCLVGVALMMFGVVNLLTDIAIVIRSAGWL